MKLTFLGTGAAAPSRTRNVSGVALQLDQRRNVWLFDCGEGTQHQFLRSSLSVSRIEKIFITHLHGDHLFGLMGLLASRSLQEGADTPVTIYGPEGLEDYVQCVLKACRMQFRAPFTVVAVEPGSIFEDDRYVVTAAALRHRIPCFGYAIREKDRPGHFDAQMARDLGVPEGPLYGLLKHGETVTLADGRDVDGQTLVGPPIKGRKVVILGDTAPGSDLQEFARDADVLVHEATYMSEDIALAKRAHHSTTLDAAQTALTCGVRALVLTHISPRYESQQNSRLPDLLAEAQAVFPNTYLADDFWSYNIAGEKAPQLP